MDILLYFNSYLSTQGNEVKALQFTDENKNACYTDLSYMQVVNLTADFEDDKPVLSFYNSDEGIKHIARFGDYIVYTDRYFMIMAADAFERKYNMLHVNKQ